MAIRIDLMAYQEELRIRREGEKRYIFDPIRKKWLVLQPEELVRQLLIHFLQKEKGYSKNRIAVERGLKVNTLEKRCDLLLFDADHRPLMLVEVKAPKVKIDQKTLDQIARYNLPLRVKYLLVTNGINSYCCKMDYQQESFTFLKSLQINCLVED